MRGAAWSLDEAQYLAGVFFAQEFKNGDDSNPVCKLIAKALNRTPGSIDRQWRNMQDVRVGKNQSNVGQVIVRATLGFTSDPVLGIRLAEESAIRNNWPMQILKKSHVHE